jgi:hypothetical protein
LRRPILPDPAALFAVALALGGGWFAQREQPRGWRLGASAADPVGVQRWAGPGQGPRRHIRSALGLSGR